MNEEQLKIADDLLNYLKEKGGYSSLDDYPGYLRDKKHSDIDVWHVKSLFLESGLVAEKETGYLLRLTAEGIKASGMGYKKYVDDIALSEVLSRDALVSAKRAADWSVKYAKLAIAISVVAIVVSILAFLK
jgi:hypothetical protein